MSRIGWLVLVFAAATFAAPIPKLDPETERIHKLFGTMTEQVGAKLSLDEKNVLTVKLDKAPPPKKKNTDQEPGSEPFEEASSATFTRDIKGEFTATLRFQMKSDLLNGPDAFGVSVGLRVEYPSGAFGSLSASYFCAEAYSPSDQLKKKYVAIGMGSFVNPGGKNNQGTGKGGGMHMPASGPVQIRLRGVGKKILLEYQPDGKKWEAYDSVELKELGEGKLTISVISFHKAATETVLEKLELQ